MSDTTRFSVELMLQAAFDCSVAAYACYSRNGDAAASDLIDLLTHNMRLMSLAAECLKEERLESNNATSANGEDHAERDDTVH